MTSNGDEQRRRAMVACNGGVQWWRAVACRLARVEAAAQRAARALNWRLRLRGVAGGLLDIDPPLLGASLALVLLLGRHQRRLEVVGEAPVQRALL